MLTERENFFRMLDKKPLDYVSHQPSLLQMILPTPIHDRAPGFGTGTDWFGVHWTEDPDMPMMPLPTEGLPHVLEDIEDWHDIQWPDLSKEDWEEGYKKDVPVRDPNRILCAMMVSGPFERLHDLMGFEGALCALLTDPEECEAFFSKLCDFKIEQIRYLKKYYDIDMVHFQDDWGSQKDLFFSPDIWRELIKPHVKRVIDAAHEVGVCFDMHSCGKIDRIVDEIIEMDVDVLDPVQPVNDLVLWHEKFKDKVIFMGGLNAQDVIDRQDVTEEQIQKEVEEKIDLFSTDGYYIPFAVALTPNVMKALDHSFIYGRTFYHKDEEHQQAVEEFRKELAEKTEDMVASVVPGTDMKVK